MFAEMSRHASFAVNRDILAPAQIVWMILSDVCDWPSWSPTVTSIQPLGEPELRLGAQFVVRQPRLRTQSWQVQSLTNGKEFTWVARQAGLTVAASHRLVPVSERTSNVELKIEFGGLVARPMWFLVGGLTRRYLVQEADSLKRISERTFSSGSREVSTA